MKKEILETFMTRYNLGGIIPKAKWKYSGNDKRLHTRAIADNKSFVADVILNNFDGLGTDDLIICIGDTDKIYGMMSPFGEDVNFVVNKNGDRVLGFSITDNDCESYCTAADPTVMDPIPKNLETIFDFDIVIPLTEDFLAKFLKARTALKDVLDFSVGMNKKGLFEVVIGYTTANSNRIRIAPQTDPVKNKLSMAVSYPIKNIAEVFKANSDIVDGKMSITNTGLIQLYFKNDTYTSTYYQFPNKKA